MELFVFWLIICILFGILWGVVTKNIIEGKGYDENWFWWGFFFGIFAVLVAASKPRYDVIYDDEYSERLKAISDNSTLNSGGWKCSCGRINPSYTGTCACGKSKIDVVSQEERQQRQKQELSNLESLKKLKELLDMDAITQEEFEKKKKELFN